MEFQLNRPGFSLIELLIVLVILGILSGVVAIQWSGALSPLTIENSVEQIVQMDRKIRNWTESENIEGWLWYESEQKRIWIQLESNPPRRSFYQLPKTIELSDLQAFNQNEKTGPTVYFTRFGTGQDYEMTFEAGNEKYFLRFAGLTGQCTRDQ